MPAIYERDQSLLSREIDLIDDEDQRALHPSYTLQKELILVRCLHRVGDIE